MLHIILVFLHNNTEFIGFSGVHSPSFNLVDTIKYHHQKHNIDLEINGHNYYVIIISDKSVQYIHLCYEPCKLQKGKNSNYSHYFVVSTM